MESIFCYGAQYGRKSRINWKIHYDVVTGKCLTGEKFKTSRSCQSRKWKPSPRRNVQRSAVFQKYLKIRALVSAKDGKQRHVVSRNTVIWNLKSPTSCTENSHKRHGVNTKKGHDRIHLRDYGSEVSDLQLDIQSIHESCIQVYGSLFVRIPADLVWRNWKEVYPISELLAKNIPERNGTDELKYKEGLYWLRNSTETHCGFFVSAFVLVCFILKSSLSSFFGTVFSADSPIPLHRNWIVHLVGHSSLLLALHSNLIIESSHLCHKMDIVAEDDTGIGSCSPQRGTGCTLLLSSLVYAVLYHLRFSFSSYLLRNIVTISVSDLSLSCLVLKSYKFQSCLVDQWPWPVWSYCLAKSSLGYSSYRFGQHEFTFVHTKSPKPYALVFFLERSVQFHIFSLSLSSLFWLSSWI